MNPIRSLKNSFFELKKLQSMVIIAMLLALRVVLGMFANATLPIFGNAVKISGAFLPIAMAGAMFGPVPGMLVGALGDVLSYIIAPTAGGFFPGFTLTSIVTGVIFGLMLYKRKPTLLRIFTAEVVYTVICGILLNSLWLSMLYGNGFIPVLTARIVKELVMIPVNTLMLAAVLQPVKKLRVEMAEI